jgi:murein tripeptide amidase MpaA
MGKFWVTVSTHWETSLTLGSTVHAREWVTTMTVEYLAYQLIAGYGKNKNVTSFVDNYDFYLIPVVNPDGPITPCQSKVTAS